MTTPAPPLWYTGQRVRIAMTFEDINGVPFSPTGIMLTIPGSASSPQEFPGNIINDAVGSFHYDWLADVAGVIQAKVQSTQQGLECATKIQIIVAA